MCHCYGKITGELVPIRVRCDARFFTNRLSPNEMQLVTF